MLSPVMQRESFIMIILVSLLPSTFQRLCRLVGDYCLRSLETAEENARRLSKEPTLVLPHPECCETQLLNPVICEQCGVCYLLFSVYNKPSFIRFIWAKIGYMN